MLRVSLRCSVEEELLIDDEKAIGGYRGREKPRPRQTFDTGLAGTSSAIAESLPSNSLVAHAGIIAEDCINCPFEQPLTIDNLTE